MYLLNTVNPLEATGYTKEAFAFFGGNVPVPLLRLAVSEGMLKAQMDSIAYYGKHPHISASLASAIRLRCAVIYGADPCVKLNTGMLQSMGMGAESLAAVEKCEVANVDDLEDNEQAMLFFVGKAHAKPESVTKADVDALRALGWTDMDIFDALMQGETMHRVAFIEKALVRGE